MSEEFKFRTVQVFSSIHSCLKLVLPHVCLCVFHELVSATLQSSQGYAIDIHWLIQNILKKERESREDSIASLWESYHLPSISMCEATLGNSYDSLDFHSTPEGQCCPLFTKDVLSNVQEVAEPVSRLNKAFYCILHLLTARHCALYVSISPNLHNTPLR